MHHFQSVCRAKKTVANTATEEPISVESSAITGHVASIQTAPPSSHVLLSPLVAQLRETTVGPVTSIPLPHHVHSVAAGWTRSNPSPSPSLSVSVSLDRAAYGSLALAPPSLRRRGKFGRAQGQKAVADTGAQVTVVPIQLLHHLAVDETTVLPIATSINAVNAAPVDIIGGLFINISATNSKTGVTRHTRQLAYISKTVPAIYLSRESCQDLGTIPADFPQVGEFQDTKIAVIETQEAENIDTAVHCAIYGLPKCSNTGVVRPGDTSCSCLPRSLPPTNKPQLPCAPTKENLPQLKQFILERFKDSAFNCCENQVLPMINDSPPLRLHLDPTAKPTAVHTPSSIPRHWTDAVKAGLDRDERLGVIERVAVNEPVTWTSRMVVTPKSDGSPRRVIDFQSVNKYTPRQTHHTRSPWAIASSVPAGKVKTVLDNWHGYHSVPIHPADRHITCFLTPWGRYQYRTTPQGLNSAGDGYTQRSDIITEEFKNIDKCIDDHIVWDDNIEENFHKVSRTISNCIFVVIIYILVKCFFNCRDHFSNIAKNFM